MKRTQAVLVALMAASALALSAGCGSSGGSGTSGSKANFAAKPTGTLNAWAFDNADDVGKARIAYAKQQLAGVTVKYDQTGFNAQKFTTRLASGNVPDVVQMDRQFVASYAAQGLIMPLDKCFSDNKVDPKSLFYKSVLDDVTYKNEVWGVPQFFQPPAIMIDKTVLAAAGVSASDIDTSNPTALLAAITKMYKSSGGNPTTVGFDPQGPQNPYLWVLGLNGKIVDDKGAPTLDNAANVYPLEMLKKIYDAQGGYAKFKSFTDSFDFFGAKNQYVKHQVGAEVNFQWYPNVLAEFKDKVNLETVPLKDRSGKPVAVTSGQAFVIPTKSKNSTAACKWALDITSQASWLASAAARADTLAKNGGINTGLFTGEPATDKAIKAKYIKPSGNSGFDQTINAFYGVVNSGISYGASPAGQEIQTALTNAIVSVVLGQKNAKDALSAAQTDAMRAYKNIVH